MGSRNTYRIKLNWSPQSPPVGLKDAYAQAAEGIYEIQVFGPPTMRARQASRAALGDILAHELGYHIMAESVGGNIMNGGHLHNASTPGDANFVDAGGFNNWGQGSFSPEVVEKLKSVFDF